MDLPEYEDILMTRQGRRLTLAFNRPEVLNAFSKSMHRDIVDALHFAATDEESDVIVITGMGKAFSAGGDIEHMQHVIENPDEFDREAADAKRLVFALLDIEKPVIARVNGHAVGLGATIALFCDVIFAAHSAKIGDPHVAIGLVAGDGGAVIWPQLVGFPRAKEYLLTGALLRAEEAEEIGLINHAVADDELDPRVDAFCEQLLNGATRAIRWTKITINMELKRIAHALLDPGIAYESVSARTGEHRQRVAAMREKMNAKRS